mmetsp:Transcript_34127/g.98261  ORF Transcript_34127/g.98261 Transcript_34127/m.98261 type:complete len:347 (-) Transcript_34127:71-1111(-)
MGLEARRPPGLQGSAEEHDAQAAPVLRARVGQRVVLCHQRPRAADPAEAEARCQDLGEAVEPQHAALRVEREEGGAELEARKLGGGRSPAVAALVLLVEIRVVLDDEEVEAPREVVDALVPLRRQHTTRRVLPHGDGVERLGAAALSLQLLAGRLQRLRPHPLGVHRHGHQLGAVAPERVEAGHKAVLLHEQAVSPVQQQRASEVHAGHGPRRHRHVPVRTGWHVQLSDVMQQPLAKRAPGKGRVALGQLHVLQTEVHRCAVHERAREPLQREGDIGRHPLAEHLVLRIPHQREQVDKGVLWQRSCTFREEALIVNRSHAFRGAVFVHAYPPCQPSAVSARASSKP